MPSTPSQPTTTSHQLGPPRQRLYQILDARPPHLLAPPMLHIRMSHHRLYGYPLQRAPLDRNHRRALWRCDLDPPRLRLQSRVVVLQKRHASQGETGREGAVHGRGDAPLEGVSEGGGARVKQVAAFFLDHLRDDVGRVDRRGAFVPVRAGWG